MVYLFAVSLRAIGRATNPAYREFLQILNDATKEPTLANKVSRITFDVNPLFGATVWNRTLDSAIKIPLAHL